jgi:flagellar motor switch protein FliN/FliY
MGKTRKPPKSKLKETVEAEPQVQVAELSEAPQADESPPAAEAALDSGNSPNGRKRSATPADLKRILQIEVPVIVRLAEKSLPMNEILQLSPGAIIEFEKTVDQDLDLMINNKCIGTGVAVKVGENFGLRINRISALNETIKAMGGAAE